MDPLTILGCLNKVDKWLHKGDDGPARYYNDKAKELLKDVPEFRPERLKCPECGRQLIVSPAPLHDDYLTIELFCGSENGCLFNPILNIDYADLLEDRL